MESSTGKLRQRLEDITVTDVFRTVTMVGRIDGER